MIGYRPGHSSYHRPPSRIHPMRTLLLRCSLLLAVGQTLLSGQTGVSGPPSPTTQPPKGFAALFNGKDLTGWHGMLHFDPYKLANMPEAERKGQIDKWTADAKKHWTVENGELINDGH